MPVPSPTLRNINAVLDWYNECDYTAWELYPIPQKKEYRIQLYYENDKDVGAERLRNELFRIPPDDYESYIIILGSMKGAKDRVFESQVRQVFRLNEKPFGVMAGYNVGIRNNDNELLSEIRALRADLAEKQQEEEEEGEAPSGFFAGIIKEPGVKEFLVKTGMDIIKGFTRPTVQSVSGTHTAADIEQILKTLYEKGVTPDDLSKLAAMDQQQINILLSMLRK